MPRVRAALGGFDALAPGGRVVVALSGGLDSVVLLHLMRFGASPVPVEVVAAHFDHRMRPGSADDAAWVRGLCRAWGVALRSGRATTRLTSENQARETRYAFLETVAREEGAAAVLTAHHADDQAETVLFRLLRGTGPRGLTGIPHGRTPGILRPLLSFWREELEEHARRTGLSWREDPSNRDLRYARNVLRRRVLPEVERLVAPGARKALVRLADLSREDEAGWRSVLPDVMAPLGLVQEDDELTADAASLAALHPAVRARVLREMARRLGSALDASTTRLAVDFVTTASSGASLDLKGPLSLRRELGRIALVRARALPADRQVVIPDAGPGTGLAVLGGREIRVSWGEREGDGGDVPTSAAFDPALLRFPLLVRARRPGDRIRLHGGTKKVKKVLLERRIPSVRRARVPLVVDADGAVLWIPEVARAYAARRPGPDALTIGIS